MIMEQRNTIESNNVVPQEQQAKTPEQIALEKYDRAISNANKIIASAEQEQSSGGIKKLTGISSANAHYMLDTISWDRNFTGSETQGNNLSEVPDNVIEAQRLIYGAYKPSDVIQQFQKQVYKKSCNEISNEEFESVIEGWGSMDTEQKKSFLRSFVSKLSNSFGFEKEIPLVFMSHDMDEAEATYVEGQGIAIPKSFFSRNKNLFYSLELLAHEVNHAVQEKLIKSNDSTDIPDVEWFRLSEERRSFITDQEFKKRGRGIASDSLESTYRSLPMEQDSFNAQRIFREELDSRVSSVIDRKLESLHLPPYSEVKFIFSIFNVIDEFVDIGIPVTEENLIKRLTKEEKDYLEKNRGGKSYEEYYDVIKGIRKNILENFKDVF